MFPQVRDCCKVGVYQNQLIIPWESYINRDSKSNIRMNERDLFLNSL